VPRPALEVADIFRDFGPAWRHANVGHVSLDQLKVMSAIERCRTVALGGHVARCESAICGRTTIAYNSCRNRHCPKCQGAAARDWLADREAELLPVGYFHVVFTLPGPIADIAFQNKRVIYDLLFKASAETMLTIAADKKHLGAKIAITSVLHTWGSAMTHHPHVHMIVPGGGISSDESKWVSCRPKFFLPVRVLSRLFRRLFLQMLDAAHADGQLKFFGAHTGLADKDQFARFLKPLRKSEWVVYAKQPFGGPEAVLAYLSRYTHRIAISNRRLIKADETGVTFKWKDYRVEGPDRYKTMTLSIDAFIRRFLNHVLPKRFHRIRHYGLLANGNRAANVARARVLLGVPETVSDDDSGTDNTEDKDQGEVAHTPCPSCGGRMIIMETFERGCTPKHRPSPSAHAPPRGPP
jgi:Putative transposase/Transposase zinc-binding domain